MRILRVGDKIYSNPMPIIDCIRTHDIVLGLDVRCPVSDNGFSGGSDAVL